MCVDVQVSEHERVSRLCSILLRVVSYIVRDIVCQCCLCSIIAALPCLPVVSVSELYTCIDWHGASDGLLCLGCQLAFNSSFHAHPFYFSLIHSSIHTHLPDLRLEVVLRGRTGGGQSGA